MHSRTSGLSDYLATDERDAIRLGRAILARINWHKLGPPPRGPATPPRYDPDEILGLVPADVKVPFDPREVLARTVDGSEFDEYKPLYETSLVTGWAQVHGYPVGVLANQRGVLFSEEAKKAAEFILLANQTDTPLVFLQNTTGYMVGAAYEQGGIIKDGAKMINAVTPTRTRAHHTSGWPTRRSGCPLPRPPTRTCAVTSSSRRRKRPAPTPSTPATGSCPRTPRSPPTSPRPG